MQTTTILFVVLEVALKISCVPVSSDFVISSYSSVRLQQPKTGLSVESEMPKEIMMNPILADEPPVKVDKMESIFIKDEQLKGITKMSMDEETIMKSINEKKNNVDEKPEIEPKIIEQLLDEKDFLMMFRKEEPVGFSLASSTSTPTTSTTDSPTTNEEDLTTSTLVATTTQIFEEIFESETI